MEYIVLCGQIVGGSPLEVVYNCDGRRFKSRNEAISHGFNVRGSDDFNIGVINGKRLVSLDWMDNPIDTAPDLLAQAVKSACLELDV